MATKAVQLAEDEATVKRLRRDGGRVMLVPENPRLAPFEMRDGRIVGTITIYPPKPKHRTATYRDPHTHGFGQFAVEPALSGQGIGRRLHQAALEHALSQGARFMALDTAEPATDLIATYERWGYTIVERVQWGDTNYPSVLMRRALGPA